jgi:1-acyl-sn-glycerol-3-phosphate acyltransferase
MPFWYFFFIPFNPMRRNRLTLGGWGPAYIWLAKVICGIKYEVKGLENLPKDQSVVVLSKHQSAWETVGLSVVLPTPLCFVFKKELLYIPFFGWGIGLLKMIALDRKRGKRALSDLVEQGQKKLAEGYWILLFPEGTRTKIGELAPEYKAGGVHLASKSNAPILPIALNSGEFWPRNAFIKQPGTITVSIGPMIYPEGKSVGQLLDEVSGWIEAEMRVISPQHYPVSVPSSEHQSVESVAPSADEVVATDLPIKS